MIHLSKAAIREILRLQSRNQTSGALFRLGVEANGCLGLSYTMGFDTVVSSTDQIYDCEGMSVLVNSQDLQYVRGLTLDYSEDLMGGGFRFDNPNSVQSCECGNSFAMPQTVSHQ
ncbi:MAG: iron-sulfur cluster assembly accessory protein [Leptolyngbyaceae bacterium]|nr:iron-sulfur cluster assembly accessory protein [Leptolyngbyaceae bacterium]